MAIAAAIKILSDLQQEGTVHDFMLFGSIAAMAHTRPFYTRDIDVIIDVSSDQEFQSVFNRLADFGEVQGFAIVIGDTPVELFPANISPIIEDALAHADRRQVDDVLVKVARPEHLLLEALRVFRNQDQGRVFLLDEVVDRPKLRRLMERLDHDGILEERYRRLTRKAP